MALNAQRALNINDFLSRVSKNGYSRLNRIAVVIKPPQELLRILKYKEKDDYLTYYAETVFIPGYELATTEMNLGGPTMTVPVKSEYRDMRITFVADDRLRQKTFFDAWLNYINPKENKYDFRYRDDYIGEMEVIHISEGGDRTTYGIVLYEVFPVAINDIQGTWSEQEPVRFDVVFSYRYWRSMNADSYELKDSDIPEQLESIDVIGNERSGRERLESIDVIGDENRRSSREILESIDVIGNNTTGRRRGWDK